MRLIIIVILFVLNLTFMYVVETSGEKFQAKALKRAAHKVATK